MNSNNPILRIAFYTLGCKVNFSETSFLVELVVNDHLIRVRHTEKADFYIVHSCILTSQAEKKTRHAIAKAHRLNPDAKIIVLGCLSQLKPKEMETLPGVYMVAGNNTKFDLPRIIQQLIQNKDCKSETDNVHENSVFHISWSKSDRTRSFLKIQDGCNCYCNYCIVPYARGKSRSAQAEDVIHAVDEIAKAGFHEIVLTGINLGDYGKDRKESIIDAIRIIHEHENIQRIRISSLEPDHFNEQFFKSLPEFPKLMQHFHIPLQAGENSTLKRMGRRNTTEDIIKICNSLTETYSDVCIAADVITGFPGETDEEFEKSRKLYESLPLAYLHVFTFSAREGTKAEHFPDQIHPQIKKQRTKILLELSNTKKKDFYLKAQGQIRPVLAESDNKNGMMFGFTDNYIKVSFPYDKNLVNKIINVKLLVFSEDEFVFKGQVM